MRHGCLDSRCLRPPCTGWLRASHRPDIPDTTARGSWSCWTCLDQLVWTRSQKSAFNSLISGGCWHRLVPHGQSIRIDLDVGIVESSDPGHGSKILKNSQYSQYIYFFFPDSTRPTLFQDLFSCMKITTCSMSFSDPAYTGPLAMSRPRTRPSMMAIVCDQYWLLWWRVKLAQQSRPLHRSR
ncbi:hypothetical protein VTN96DRAFT_10172 [Rasamsonia emersonii]